ncbi:hypothetical protein BaRGS_00021350 [Batillaria attramentaria]|uniref:Uncharacterized protein n=1 Tax=Batillaria attramentaria TaxID=370345 RepID=A0ABD0KJI3_9CAEN
MSGRKPENPRRYFRSLLQRSVPQFMETLSSNIMQGPHRRDHALLQIELLVANDMTDILEKFRVNEDESLLQLAAIFHGDVEVMERLGAACPRLLLHQRQGDYEGQTVLHTVVSKQNIAAADAILRHPNLREAWILLNGKAVGPRFAATVMMGELPLTVAALTFNVPMVDLLLSHGARIHATNSLGDTVFHSLVRFAALYPEKTEDVEHMMREIHKRLQTPRETNPASQPAPQAEPKAVWLMENKEGLTVLRLAAALAQPSLFKLVLGLEGVYCQLDQHDGLFDSLLYDVTEIDPVANRRWHILNSGGHRRNEIAPVRADGIPSPTHRKLMEVGCCPTIDTPAPSATKGNVWKRPWGEGGGRSASVLEIICETGRVEKAFEILNTYVVRSIVKSKWSHYRWWFVGWALVHILLMTLLTVYAVYKARVISHNRNPPPTPNNTISVPEPQAKDSEETFVAVVAWLTLPLAVVVVVWEVMRVVRGQPFNLWLIHHNGLYRVELVVFALSLLLDTIWYLIEGPVNNHFLVLALLVGWWFTTFFLRPLKKFSFFTVMLQKVLLGDMLRFSTIIVLVLLAFSVAMYITYLPMAGPLPDEFEHLGATFLTMFNLMLGLTEITVLYSAPYPWLAISLFVLFILLTYLLMLNALIAMMSNTCSLVSENKLSQWELQRLSVVLLLESMLPCECLSYNSGRHMYVARYDLKRKQMIQEGRFFTKVTSVQTDYSDGRAILKRKSMMQTQRFDDIHAVMASINSHSHIDLLASFTHQQALLHGEHLFDGRDHKMPALREEAEDSCGPVQEDIRPYDSVRKPENYASYRKRVALNQASSEQRPERDYASVRQRLLTHFMAAQFSSQLAERHMRSESQPQLYANEDRMGQAGEAKYLRDPSFDSQDGSEEAVQPRERNQQPLSPHTPKGVQLQEKQQAAPTEPTPAAQTPKPRRKRHNSERVPSQHGKLKLERQDLMSKSMMFPSEEGRQPQPSQQEAPELLPQFHHLAPVSGDRIQAPDESGMSAQPNSGRQMGKVAPKFPSPDVFVISPKTSKASTEA